MTRWCTGAVSRGALMKLPFDRNPLTVRNDHPGEIPGSRGPSHDPRGRSLSRRVFALPASPLHGTAWRISVRVRRPGKPTRLLERSRYESCEHLTAEAAARILKNREGPTQSHHFHLCATRVSARSR